MSERKHNLSRMHTDRLGYEVLLVIAFDDDASMKILSTPINRLVVIENHGKHTAVLRRAEVALTEHKADINALKWIRTLSLVYAGGDEKSAFLNVPRVVRTVGYAHKGARSRGWPVK